MSATDNWVPGEATIFSAEYIPPQGENRPCWQLTYSYWVDGEIYSGSTTDFSNDTEVTYHKDDKLQIQYLRTTPGKSRVPSAKTFWQRARIFFLIGAVVGLVVVLLQILMH